MSRSTISTFELFDLFPDEETARIYFAFSSKIFTRPSFCT